MDEKSRTSSQRKARTPRREPMFLPEEGNDPNYRKRPMRRRRRCDDKPKQDRPLSERLRKVPSIDDGSKACGCPMGMCAAAPSLTSIDTPREPKDDQTIVDKTDIKTHVLTSAMLCSAASGLIVAGVAGTALFVWRLIYG